MRLAVLPRFAVLSFLCILGLALAMGAALSWLLTRAVSDWEWENTAAFAQREVELLELESFFTGAAADPAKRAAGGRRLAGLFAGLPEVVRVKAWDRQATVLWSDEAQLIGRRFPDNDELQEALAGHIAVEIKRPEKAENAYERAPEVVAEVYVPIFAREGGRVVGVIEVYKTPVRLMATIRRARLLVWGISLAGGLALYLVMLPLVRQVYGREVRAEALRAHTEILEAQMAERTAALEQQKEQLLQAQKMEAIGLLAGGVAHDFNNLMTVVLGRSELLRHGLEPDHRLQSQVRMIDETARRAVTLTKQLLAFSRKQVLQLRLVDLNAVVAQTEVMLSRLIGEDIELTATLAPDLGRVRADPAQLEQVLVNLAVNARDAMPRGGRLAIRTAETEIAEGDAYPPAPLPPGRYVTLTVSDTGMGMDAATRTRVFEPFFTTKGPGHGTGLGMATVYGIVSQSGGQVAVESTPGRGATFTIYLPRVGEPDPEPTEPEAGSPALPRGSETILLVEDEAPVRDLAREVLATHGYHVLEAARGADALRIAEDHRGAIGLLLTDVVMPEMSGSELAGRLRRLRPDTAVLYTSGYTDDATVRHGVVEAQVRFLPKPFTAETLTRAVREALDAGGHGRG